MFVDPSMNLKDLKPAIHGHDALAAILTLIIICILVWAFNQTKPSTQRLLLRLMFQPVLATVLLFTVWFLASLFSLFLSF